MTRYNDAIFAMMMMMMIAMIPGNEESVQLGHAGEAKSRTMRGKLATAQQGSGERFDGATFGTLDKN